MKRFQLISFMLLAGLTLCIFAAPSLAQNAWSRGIQNLSISHEECVKRARLALEAEGYTIQNQGGDAGGDYFYGGYKDIHIAIIACNSAADGRTWANIFVSSQSNDAGVPGAERVKLQARMELLSQSGGALEGDWNIKCCNDELGWTLSIKNQDGNSFSGSFSAEYGGGIVTNGLLNGNSIEFDRIEYVGGGWKQHWSAQLINDGGRLRMINGVWTGSYLEQFTGRNNWHAEKR